MTGDELIKDVVGDLEAMELLRPSEVCYGKVMRTKYGYVVQESHYRKDLDLAKAYFQSIGIPLCGRVAEFEYINMDVCIGRGQRVAGEVMNPAVAGERGRVRMSSQKRPHFETSNPEFAAF